MTPEAVLARHAEPVPDWLAQWTARARFPRDAFFSSRVVIYPGGGGDGHAFKVFGGSHAAHCFIHPDYGVSRDTVLSWLTPESPEKLRGYRALGHVDLTMADLIPDGWHPPAFLSAEEMRRIAEGEHQARKDFGSVTPYAMFIAFDRDEGLDDRHGPTRLAALFLAANAQITYHALFCQRGSSAPFGMVLQDHGFGGNYDKFGEGGLLHRFAMHASSFPRFILGEQAWSGYEQLSDEPSIGGVHSNRRHLFTRSADAAPPDSRGL